MALRNPPESMVDFEIDYMNKKRNIPGELSTEEQILYTFSRDVTGELLENMCTKYASAIEESPQEPIQEMPTQTEEDIHGVDDLLVLMRR